MQANSDRNRCTRLPRGEIRSLTVATVTLGGWGSGVVSALVDDSGAMAGAADPGTGAESILQKGRRDGESSSSQI